MCQPHTDGHGDSDTYTDGHTNSHSYGDGNSDSDPASSVANPNGHAPTYADAQAAADASSAGASALTEPVKAGTREKLASSPPQGGSAFPEDDGRQIAEGANTSGGKAALTLATR